MKSESETSRQIDTPSPRHKLDHCDSGLLMQMMSMKYDSPVPRSRLAELYPISLKFKKESLERKFSIVRFSLSLSLFFFFSYFVF